MPVGGGLSDAVTGAFNYSGAAIAEELQARGRRVRTLTGHAQRAPTGTDIDVEPLDFTDPASLTRSLRDVRTLYNTGTSVPTAGDGDHAVSSQDRRPGASPMSGLVAGRVSGGTPSDREEP